MSRRRVGAAVAIVFASAFILIASTRISFSADHPRTALDAFQESFPPVRDGDVQSRSYHSSARVPMIWASNDLDNMTLELLLSEQRQMISAEMSGYIYPGGRYNISARCLDDLVPERGGEPIRSVLITTWRSGSTFLGDVLNSQPGNFYHYEPLLPLEIVQVGDGSPLADSSINSLRQLLLCNYTGLEDSYLSYGRDHNWLMSHNARVWDYCGQSHELCLDPTFLSRSCKLFPFQSMKVVRLRLRLASRLLEDKSLNVRMILLVRDPRGTVQSRRHREWCPPSPDCSDPKRLCADLVEDYWAAVDLMKVYPDRLRVLRYEELSLNPTSVTEDLFQFLGLAQGSPSIGDVDDRDKNGPLETSDRVSNEGRESDLHPAILHFLETHTKADQGGVSSTHRDSRSAPFRWRKELTPGEIANIQSSCKEAMHLWGYKELAIKRSSGSVRGGLLKSIDSDDFNPLASFHLE